MQARKRDARWEIEGTGDGEKESSRRCDALPHAEVIDRDENGGVTRRAGLRSEEEKMDRERERAREMIEDR